MVRFLHLADIHLGFDKYDTPERTKDFFHALYDALERYALSPAVDFVLIAGDLFEHRNILPATLNQSQICLELLQQAQIPVLAIEGNHDHRPYGTPTSWLRYLAEQDLLILLEPNEAGELEPWDAERKIGGYIDLDCGVRVIGSRWYGASSPQAIPPLAESIRQLPASPHPTVMMFHHGLEGQIARYAGALRYQDFLPLQQAGVDYLALGHIHKNYTEQGWIFNPGAIEANSITENQAQNPRGVYLVTLDQQGIRAELKQDYCQRPILRLSVVADIRQSPAELEQAAIACVQQAAQAGETEAAIVELKMSGQVSFNRLDLDVRPLRQQLQAIAQALIFLLRYDVTSTTYVTPLSTAEDDLPTRQEIEQHVFTDFLAANFNYSDRAPQFAQGLIDLKAQILSEQPEAETYKFIQTLLAESKTRPQSSVEAADISD
jgi:DNA repair protein SbcD/Mre11